MNLKSFAEQEFDILEKHMPGAVVLEFKDEILALINKFAESGQSGGSAPYVSKIISSVVGKLCMYIPITPVTGEDDEWIEFYSKENETWYQNKRCGKIFKNGIDDTPHYLDAIIFKEEDGHCFSGWADVPEEYTEKYGQEISYSQNIKSFPFEPKTFYIDVTSKEYADKEEKEEKAGGGWWSHKIANIDQLEEVFEYYDLNKSKN